MIDNKEYVAAYKIQGIGRVAFLLLLAYAWRDMVLINYIEDVEDEPEGTGSQKLVLQKNFIINGTFDFNHKCLW